MHDLNSFQRDILWTIVGTGELHGLGIKEKLEERYEKDINHGRLYPNLDTLVDLGLVRKQEVDGRTNSYQLTRRGRQEVADQFEWQSAQMQERFHEEEIDGKLEVKA